MHPHIRVAKSFEFDPEEDMEKARRKLPMFDLNVNRKFHIFGHHTHHKKSHHKIAPHESIYSVPIRKMTWAGHAVPRDQKHLLSPTLSPATEGASSPCSPSHFMHRDASITSSPSSSECHKSGRRRSMI
uniref:Uncharacterized protein n=1 Tax=Acrobeloides nanus TaxID=290746 RepID=A0A914CC34_9BILA